MELDLWEGQFNLSSLQGLEGLTEEEYEEDYDYSRGSTCWGEDSVVTMGTVSAGCVEPDLMTRSHCRSRDCRRRSGHCRRNTVWRRGNTTQ